MSETVTDIEWFKNVFTTDSSTKDIIEFIKKIFELEKMLKIDVIKTLENSIDVNHYNFTRIDVTDGINLIECILTKIVNNEHGIEKFLAENQHFFLKYNINSNLINNKMFENFSFSGVMHVISIIGKKKNRQMIQEGDLCDIINIAPDIVTSSSVALADLVNELASLCITSPSKSEIKIQINSPSDIRVSIDTASLINNIRESLKLNVDNLSSVYGKMFNIEISDKLTKGIMNHNQKDI